MTRLATLNFKISRLRYQMKGMQSDIRLLTNAGLDCSQASERLRRMQADLLVLIAEREGLTCPAERRRMPDGRPYLGGPARTPPAQVRLSRKRCMPAARMRGGPVR